MFAGQCAITVVFVCVCTVYLAGLARGGQDSSEWGGKVRHAKPMFARALLLK